MAESFLNTHATFTKLDLWLHHNTSLNKFPRTEIIQSILSDQNGIKLEPHNKKIIFGNQATGFQKPKEEFTMETGLIKKQCSGLPWLAQR